MKLNVTKFKNGAIVKSKEGSDRASIYLTSLSYVNNNGSIWEQKRIAILTVPKTMVSLLDVAEGSDLNPKLIQAGLGEHTIIMQESLKPFYEGQEPKRKGSNGDVITTDNGSPIYQQFVCVPKSSNLVDTRVNRVTIAEEIHALEA